MDLDLHKLLDSHELQSTPLLRGVELESIQTLLEGCPIQELKRGDVLIRAGQRNRFLYLVLSGRLNIHLKDHTLDPIVELQPGEVAGELSVIDCQVTSAYVVAAEDCCVLLLDEKTIWALVDFYPIVARNLLFVLAQRLRNGNVIIEASLLEEVSEKELKEFQPREVPADKGLPERDLPEGNIEAEPAKLYKAAKNYVLEAIRGAEAKKGPDLTRGEELVKGLHDSMADSSALLLLATDRRQEFSVSAHCVNVAIFSLRMAQTLKYDLENQFQVGLAGLLHEIGVARLPKRVLHQPQPMHSEMRHRPAYGAELLHKFNPECDWLIESVGQVYEREDGSGFPLGLQGRDIREEAKILGIVDVFEASIHDRPYRKALTGYQLLEGLTLGATTSFSDHVVKALIESFSVYPYNEYVVLNSDEVGQVVEVNPRNSWRPVVKILFDKDGVPLEEPKETDLAQASSLFITKAITYHELPDVG